MLRLFEMAPTQDILVTTLIIGKGDKAMFSSISIKSSIMCQERKEFSSLDVKSEELRLMGKLLLVLASERRGCSLRLRSHLLDDPSSIVPLPISELLIYELPFNTLALPSGNSWISNSSNCMEDTKNRSSLNNRVAKDLIAGILARLYRA